MIRRVGWLVLLTAAMWGVGLGEESTPASTQPTGTQVLQLMSAMGVQQEIDSALQSTQNTMKQSARIAFLKKHPDADAETLKKLDEVFDSTQLFNFEAVSESLIPAYQRNLTAADVQAGIDFYTSEAGKRLLAKLPKVIHEANEGGGQLVQQKLEAYSEELQRKLEAFEAELNKPKVPEKSTAVDKPKTAADDKPKTDDTKAVTADDTKTAPSDDQPKTGDTKTTDGTSK